MVTAAPLSDSSSSSSSHKSSSSAVRHRGASHEQDPDEDLTALIAAEHNGSSSGTQLSNSKVDPKQGAAAFVACCLSISFIVVVIAFVAITTLGVITGGHLGKTLARIYGATDSLRFCFCSFGAVRTTKWRTNVLNPVFAGLRHVQFFHYAFEYRSHLAERYWIILRFFRPWPALPVTGGWFVLELHSRSLLLRLLCAFPAIVRNTSAYVSLPSPLRSYRVSYLLCTAD